MPSPRKRHSPLPQPRLFRAKTRPERRSTASPPLAPIRSPAIPVDEDILATSFAFCMTTNCRPFGPSPHDWSTTHPILPYRRDAIAHRASRPRDWAGPGATGERLHWIRKCPDPERKRDPGLAAAAAEFAATNFVDPAPGLRTRWFYPWRFAWRNVLRLANAVSARLCRFRTANGGCRLKSLSGTDRRRTADLDDRALGADVFRCARSFSCPRHFANVLPLQTQWCRANGLGLKRRHRLLTRWPDCARGNRG